MGVGNYSSDYRESSGHLLQAANLAMRRGEFLNAINLYHEHAIHIPELSWMHEVSVSMARKKGLRWIQTHSTISTKKRAAIFASFNRNNAICNYVIHYLTHLRKVADFIVFVGDFDCNTSQSVKLHGLVDKCIFGRHFEYDFGSYKRGFEFFINAGFASFFDELIFCNDSCFGPVHDFSWIFYEMSKRNVDFWGLTQSPEFERHIQSYFFTINKAVFTSNEFSHFISGVKREVSVDHVIRNYETKLTRFLSGIGFTWDTLINDHSPGIDRRRLQNPNPTTFPSYLLRAGAELVKVKAIKNEGFSMEDKQITLNIIYGKNPELLQMILEE